MTRREAREHVMKLLFQKDFFGQEEYDSQAMAYLERFAIGEKHHGFILKEYNKGHLHLGLGGMYEYERWNFTAVPSSVIVLDNTPVQNHYFKMNLYISYTQKIKEIVYFQMATFFQTRPDSYFIYPRLSVNGMITLNFTKHIHFSIRYDVFYDALPVVPIDNLYFSFTNKLSFTF